MKKDEEWIIDLYIRAKAIKLLEKNIGIQVTAPPFLKTTHAPQRASVTVGRGEELDISNWNLKEFISK